MINMINRLVFSSGCDYIEKVTYFVHIQSLLLWVLQNEQQTDRWRVIWKTVHERTVHLKVHYTLSVWYMSNRGWPNIEFIWDQRISQVLVHWIKCATCTHKSASKYAFGLNGMLYNRVTSHFKLNGFQSLKFQHQIYNGHMPIECNCCVGAKRYLRR